jgi:long-chain acyl-CoA synthetase
VRSANLGDLLFDGELPSEGAVVIAGGVEWDRARLEERSESLAEALGALGVRPGQPVGVMLPNGADAVAAMFGVWRAGAVQVPLNPRLTDRELGSALTAVRPAAAVTVAQSAGRLAGLPTAVAEASSWTRRAGAAAHPAGHPADIAAVCFTSGTTGEPKPVVMAHSRVLQLMDGVIRRLREGGRSRRGPDRPPMPNLIPVSLSLWAGIYNVLFAFRVGAPVIVMDSFEPDVFVDLVRRFGVRSTVLPPAAMTMILDAPGVSDLSPLRYVRSISAPLSSMQARRFRDRFGISVLNGYGQTEIGGEVIGWSAADWKAHGEAKLGSVGRPHPGVEVRVVGADGAEVPADEPGELLVRAPDLGAGHTGGSGPAAPGPAEHSPADPSLADRVVEGGWLRTGDVARIDPDGFVWIEGRVSDMINRGGLKVFPAEVEEVIRLSPAVEDAAVVGIPDGRLGEVPAAFVVTGGRRRLTAELERHLEELCRAHLVAYKVPVSFREVEELPRNEAGKVLKAQLAGTGRRR